MSEPFLAEIRIVGFNFAPRGWALCDGQIVRSGGKELALELEERGYDWILNEELQTA